MTKICALLLAYTAIVLFSASILGAQSAPTLKPAFSGAIAVAGSVARGIHEVSVYDLSYPTEVKLGTSKSVDENGKFVVVVKPPLITGHRIVAVDGSGAKSEAIVVAAPPAGPNVQPKARP